MWVLAGTCHMTQIKELGAKEAKLAASLAKKQAEDGAVAQVATLQAELAKVGQGVSASSCCPFFCCLLIGHVAACYLSFAAAPWHCILMTHRSVGYRRCIGRLYVVGIAAARTHMPAWRF